MERLLQNAGTFIKLNDIPKAVDIYEGLTNNYPEDYRAWWELARIYSEDFQNCYMCTEEEYLKIKKLMQNGITLSSGQGKENFQDIFLEYENNYNAFMKNFNKSKLSGDQKKKGTRYLLKRGFELLAVGKVEQSKERFEKCLAVEENLAEAYWGLLLIERQCFNEEQLMEQLKCIDNEEYYKKACAKAEGTVKRHYQDIAEMIRKKCEKRKAKILDDYTDKEQDIKKSVEKIDVDIKRVQENVEKEKKEKKQILEEGKRRRLLVILVCLLIPILSGFGVSKEIIVGVGTILIPILFFVIVFMVKRTNEKVGKRDKEIDILGEEVKKMIEERRKVQKQLPEFPFAEIEDMDIPGEVKREKGMNEYIKKLYGVDV